MFNFGKKIYVFWKCSVLRKNNDWTISSQFLTIFPPKFWLFSAFLTPFSSQILPLFSKFFVSISQFFCRIYLRCIVFGWLWLTGLKNKEIFCVKLVNLFSCVNVCYWLYFLILFVNEGITEISIHKVWKHLQIDTIYRCDKTQITWWKAGGAVHKLSPEILWFTAKFSVKEVVEKRWFILRLEFVIRTEI